MLQAAANLVTKILIEISFEVAKKINLQSVAFDFVIDENDKPLIIELSYGFGVQGIRAAPRYRYNHLNWHECQFNPQEWMVDEVIKLLEG